MFGSIPVMYKYILVLACLVKIKLSLCKKQIIDKFSFSVAEVAKIEDSRFKDVYTDICSYSRGISSQSSWKRRI